MKRIALVDKYDRGNNYGDLFPGIEVEHYHLSSVNKKKLLKADKDIIIDTELYDYIILMGAEPTKHFTAATVSSHQGYLVDDKYLPLIDPSMLIFKPSMKDSFERAVSNIIEYINGTKNKQVHRKCTGVDDTDIAIEVLTNILNLEKTEIALDTETTALYPRDGYLLGISIAPSILEGYYISSDIFDDVCTELLQKIIDKHHIVFQNAKFDMSWLAYHLNLDFNLKNVKEVSSFDDTLLMHYTLDESTGTHGLKEMCIKYTDLGDYDKDLELFKRTYCRTHKIKLMDFTYDLIPFDIMVPYACIDAMGTLELFYIFQKLIKDTKLEQAYIMLKQGSKFLLHVENNGVPFSKDRLLKAQKILTDDIYKLEQEIYEFPELSRLEADLSVKFNPNSVIHLRYLFYEVLNLPKHGKKTDTGADSVDAEVLEELAKLHPVVSKIAEIKKAKKIKSTYIDKILVGLNRDNRLRTFFNLTTTTSGRLSSSGKLNMQQLPRDNKIVKACIWAPEGYTIVSGDLATAEMYVAAVLSNDKALMKVFVDKQAGKGADFHSTIAHIVFRLACEVTQVKDLFAALRQGAKAISFGILYGSGPAKVAESVNSEGDGTYTVDDAIADIATYFKTFPKLKTWLTRNQQFIKENGFVYSIFGRKRRLGDVFSGNRQVSGHEIRSGINFLIQSVASDINLKAGIELQQYINDTGIDAEIFGLVHDSILAIVKDEDLDEYLRVSKEITQRDYGVMIPGCPIGVDQEVGRDYSFKEGIFDE
jgi:DNA polymerase I-like protein with 3'-5' exonuclease and polymerase domains